MAIETSNTQLAHPSERVSHYEYMLADHHRYILEHGSDPKTFVDWKWQN